ncbi:MAG: heavy metal-binding domain-containing protein, partial [bacterium]
MAKDPICGMTVDEAASLRAERDGQTFYFCSEHCRQKFLAQPATVASAAQTTAAPQRHHAEEKPRASKVIYTCPMHPQIEQDHPGECPICGMALEPKTITRDSSEEENAELRDMTRRFWIGAALTLPVFLLAMAHLIPALNVVPENISRWMQFILSTPVVCWAGWPFFKRGWRSIKTMQLNMFTLIAIGVGAAYVFSA